MPARLIGTQ